MVEPNWIYMESIEIALPPEATFAFLTSGERLLQLHPEWGQARLEGFDERYPRQHGEFIYHPLDKDQLSYATQVAVYQPPEHFELHSQDARQTKVAFTLEPSVSGTTLTCRLAWEIEALPGALDSGVDPQIDDQSPAEGSPQAESPEGESPQEVISSEARFVVHEWLTNLKRYVELGDRRLDRLIKWLMDSFLLRLRADQRRIILILFVFQVITFITFVAAALGLGLAALIFKLGS